MWKALRTSRRRHTRSHEFADYSRSADLGHGHFEFTNAPVGKYTIYASVKGYHENMPPSRPPPFLVDREISSAARRSYPAGTGTWR